MKRSTHLLFIPIIACLTFVLISCGVFNSSNGEDEGSGPRTIVFAAAEVNEEYQIFSMREDGSGIKQLTHSDNYSSQQPAWSPDGEHIVFVRYQNTAAELWVMNADGSNPHALITNPQSGNPQLGVGPAWSPDGTNVAFASCCGFSGASNILVANLESGMINTLTQSPRVNNNPTWSPDGKRIAFSSDRDYFDADSARYRQDLYVINTDGTNIQRLTTTGAAAQPAWSPAGNLIAYEWNIRGNNEFIYNLSTGKTKKINTGLEFTAGGIWNNEGTKLLVVGRKTDQAEPELRILDLDKIPPEVLKKINLDKISGKEYDWYDKKEK